MTIYNNNSNNIIGTYTELYGTKFLQFVVMFTDIFKTQIKVTLNITVKLIIVFVYELIITYNPYYNNILNILQTINNLSIRYSNPL